MTHPQPIRRQDRASKMPTPHPGAPTHPQPIQRQDRASKTLTPPSSPTEMPIPTRQDLPEWMKSQNPGPAPPPGSPPPRNRRPHHHIQAGPAPPPYPSPHNCRPQPSSVMDRPHHHCSRSPLSPLHHRPARPLVPGGIRELARRRMRALAERGIKVGWLRRQTFRTRRASHLISSASFVLGNSWRMGALSRTITSRRSPDSTWCSASVVACRSSS